MKLIIIILIVITVVVIIIPTNCEINSKEVISASTSTLALIEERRFNNRTNIIKFYDYEYNVVCYVVDIFDGGGIRCIELKDYKMPLKDK